MRRAIWIGLAITVVACAGEDAGVSPTRPTMVDPATGEGATMELVSDAFSDGQPIPVGFTCDGDDVSPPLTVVGVPSGTVTLAVVVDDPDAPAGVWDHWVVYDMAVDGPGDVVIAEGAAGLGIDGTNSWGRTGYGGPCPPSGTHRYFFTAYALDVALDLASGASKDDVLAAMGGHVMAEATLMGTYGR